MHPTQRYSVDMSGSNSANFTPVILYGTHTDPNARNQAWSLKLIASPVVKISAKYMITNRATGTVADFSLSTRRVSVPHFLVHYWFYPSGTNANQHF